MSSQPPTQTHALGPSPRDDPAAAEEDENYVDVRVPGRTHPLRIPITNGFENTTVGHLRAATLDLLHGDGRSGDRFMRLIYRGRELNDADSTLAAAGVSPAAALHGLPAKVQPQGQRAAATTGARAALSTAIGSFLGSGTDGAAGPAAAADTAGARAQMSQNEMLRLLHEETMVRRAAQQPVGRSTPGAQVGVEGVDGGMPATAEIAHTTDGWSARVPAQQGTSDAAVQVGDVPGGDADGDEEEFQAVDTRRFLKLILCPVVVGFLFGPASLFLFQDVEVIMAVVGILLNVVNTIIW